MKPPGFLWVSPWMGMGCRDFPCRFNLKPCIFEAKRHQGIGLAAESKSCWNTDLGQVLLAKDSSASSLLTHLKHSKATQCLEFSWILVVGFNGTCFSWLPLESWWPRDVLQTLHCQFAMPNVFSLTHKSWNPHSIQEILHPRQLNMVEEKQKYRARRCLQVVPPPTYKTI